MSADIGSRVGQYRIVREIARGGMGVVYEALHDEIGRRAAIKMLSPEYAADSQYVRRFLNEARAISSVTHPGLVQIYDFGQTPADVPYILMELLDGETLRVRMTRHARLEIADVRRAVRQIAATLAATHEQGIAHRDLKPENVMFVPDDEAPGGERIKLLDFGIARFFASSDVTLTAPGIALGTIAYMSPEQCVGDRDLSSATDVYSLGVILYELVGGAPPFTGPSGSAVMRMHVTVEPPPLPSGTPADLAALASRMLAKEPTLRPSMREVVASLAIDDEATTAPWPARRGSPRKLMRYVAPTLAIAAIAGTWPVYRAVREPEQAAQPAEMTSMIRFGGGMFRMGLTAEERKRECAFLGALCYGFQLDREQPARAVTLSSFYLDQFEATNEEVAAWLWMMAPSLEVRVDPEVQIRRWVYLDGDLLADLKPPHAGIEHNGKGYRARPGYERKPAVQLTWDGASQYCKWRRKRLPTEAEWEFAARGVAGRRFPWGDQRPSCDAVVWGRGDQGCAAPSRGRGPEAVGTTPHDRTPEGVHDLGGNVTEWVADQSRLPFYPPCGKCENPRVEEPVAPAEDVRVIRGGSWSQDWHKTRGAMRGQWNRNKVMINGGFRCAL